MWGVPADHAANSGLSDRMAPGVISELSLSDAVAFRVDFEGPRAAAVAALLARAGARHVRRPRMDARRTTAVRRRSRSRSAGRSNYTVTLEPHWKPWLFALDLPRQPAAGRRGDPSVAVARPTPTPFLRATSSCWRACRSRSRCATGRRRTCATPTRRSSGREHDLEIAESLQLPPEKARVQSADARLRARTARQPRRRRPLHPRRARSLPQRSRSSTRSRRRCSAPIRSTASCSTRAAASASTTRAHSSCCCAPPAFRRASSPAIRAARSIRTAAT